MSRYEPPAQPQRDVDSLSLIPWGPVFIFVRDFQGGRMLSVRIIDLVGFFLAGPCRIANTPCLDQGGAKQLKIEIMFNCILWATRPALITPYSPYGLYVGMPNWPRRAVNQQLMHVVHCRIADVLQLDQFVKIIAEQHLHVSATGSLSCASPAQSLNVV